MICDVLTDVWTLGLHEPARRPKQASAVFARTLDDLQRYWRGRILHSLTGAHRLPKMAARRVFASLLEEELAVTLSEDSLLSPQPESDPYLDRVADLLGGTRLFEFGLGPELRVLAAVSGRPDPLSARRSPRRSTLSARRSGQYRTGRTATRISEGQSDGRTATTDSP